MEVGLAAQLAAKPVLVHLGKMFNSVILLNVPVALVLNDWFTR